MYNISKKIRNLIHDIQNQKYSIFPNKTKWEISNKFNDRLWDTIKVLQPNDVVHINSGSKKRIRIVLEKMRELANNNPDIRKVNLNKINHLCSEENIVLLQSKVNSAIKQKNINDKEMREFISKIKYKGYKRIQTKDDYLHRIELESDKIKIKFTVSNGPCCTPWKDDYETFSFSGSTNFLVEGTWFTFDRLGVSASFDGDSTGKYSSNDAKTVIEEQIKKCEESVARRKRSTSVPGIPFVVTPERQKEIGEYLNKKGSYTFMPSGFGTGYTISKRLSRFANRASSELSKFFNVDSPLYVSTFDAD